MSVGVEFKCVKPPLTTLIALHVRFVNYMHHRIHIRVSICCTITILGRSSACKANFANHCATAYVLIGANRW